VLLEGHPMNYLYEIGLGRKRLVPLAPVGAATNWHGSHGHPPRRVAR